MSEIFTPNSKSIINLFAGPVSYQIPSYQRPYKWDTERVEQLWEDLLSAFEEGAEEYFLGSVILIKKGDNSFEVVDGQQRMTTLTILFCVLRDVYYTHLPDKTKANLVSGRIKNLETDEKRLKFRTQPHHQNKFENEILNGIDFTKSRSKKDIEDDPFINAAYIFKDKINSPETRILGRIEEFTDYILNKVRVITIECSSQSFAIKLFQTLNTRGMDLTASDLIKSELMLRLEDKDMPAFEQDWISVEDKAKEFGEELSNLFTYYEYYLLASNPKRSLYEELVRLFANKDPKAVIYEFKKLVGYFDEIDSENSKVIDSLGYLRHDVFWKSILLSAKMEGWEKSNLLLLAKLLRNFYYLYWIAGYTTSKTKQTSFNIISWIKNKNDLTHIKEKVGEKIKEDRVTGNALKNLKGEVYDFAWCKPLFAVIEYHQTDDSICEYIDIDKYVHIEHILPRGYSKIKYWNDLFSEEQADKLVNTLGNLTLLSGKKNIEASNRAFPEKIKIYEGKGIDGMTSYRITQRLVDTIHQNKDWTSERILERGDKFIQELGQIFDVDFNVAELIEEDEAEISESTQELYNLLQEEILKINPEIKIEPKKHYIAFKKKGNFASAVIQSHNIKIWLHLDKEKLSDAKGLTRDVSEIGHHGTGNIEVILSKKEDMLYVLELIKQSYQKVEEGSEEEQDFDETHVQEMMNSETYSLFNKFREELKKITVYEEKINKQFIGYRNKTHYFATVNLRQNFFYLNILDIDKQYTPSLPNKKAGYEERNKNIFIKIESEEDIRIALPLMKFSRKYKTDE